MMVVREKEKIEKESNYWKEKKKTKTRISLSLDTKKIVSLGR